MSTKNTKQETTEQVVDQPTFYSPTLSMTITAKDVGEALEVANTETEKRKTEEESDA